jgi:hypothetical protein
MMSMAMIWRTAIQKVGEAKSGIETILSCGHLRCLRPHRAPADARQRRPGNSRLGIELRIVSQLAARPNVAARLMSLPG